MDVEAAANEIGGDAGLEIGECQDKIEPQCEDLVDVRRCEGADSRFVVASLWRAHNIAGDADDSILLAEEVERLDGLFGEADNSAWREHRTLAYPSARRQRYQLSRPRHAATSEAQ